MRDFQIKRQIPEVGDRIYHACHSAFVVKIVNVSELDDDNHSIDVYTDSEDSADEMKELDAEDLTWDSERKMWRYDG